MAKKIIKNLISDYIINEYGLDENNPYEVQEVDARSLITPSRLDLIAKWMYIEFKERNIRSSFGKDLYAQHIEAFSLGSFTEMGSPEKNSLYKYTSSFDSLIDSIKKNGLNVAKSIIPVGNSGIPLDGSHRIAACAYFDTPITIAKVLPAKQESVYDYSFFLKRGLSVDCVDAMVLEYTKIKNSSYAICIWPEAFAVDKGSSAHKIINDSEASIIYQKKLTLSHKALENLLLQTSSSLQWYELNKGNNPTTFTEGDMCVYFLSANSLDVIERINTAIQENYNSINRPLYVTKNQQQTVQLAKIILNRNSLHYLDNANINMSFSIHKQLEEFTKHSDQEDSDLDNRIAGPESTISIYGIRDKGRLDLLSIDGNTHELIYNPANHLYFRNIKFISLPKVIKFKQDSKKPEDIADLKYIRNIIPSNISILSQKSLSSARKKIYHKYLRTRRLVSKVVNRISIKLSRTSRSE